MTLMGDDEQKNIYNLKVTYKTILCHKVGLDVQLMNFFI